MAKTRAQRKAERRAREAEQQRQGKSGGGVERERERESHAQHDTQVPISGDVAEFEAAIDTQSAPPAPEAPPAPAPSRAEVPAPAEPPKKSRRELRAERKAEKERERKQLESQQKLRRDAPVEERRRGAVIGFIASCWAELKKVQWPDRDTLIQASAVTLIFVAVLAAYLGALDYVFNLLVKQIL